MHCVYEYFLLFTTSSAGQFPKCDDSTGGEWCGVFSKTLPNTSTAPQRKALFPNNIITRHFYNTIDIVINTFTPNCVFNGILCLIDFRRGQIRFGEQKTGKAGKRGIRIPEKPENRKRSRVQELSGGRL